MGCGRGRTFENLQTKIFYKHVYVQHHIKIHGCFFNVNIISTVNFLNNTFLIIGNMQYKFVS